MFFPILAPPDTVGGEGQDSLSVGKVDLVSRYTTVQPNPAKDKVKVLSSFGLTQIEAFDTKGTLVHSQRAEGLKATLDVRAWPEGTYLLRVTTPAGTVTKKLLVSQR